MGIPTNKDLSIISYDDWPEVVTPGEIGDLFRVNSKTVSRWALAGRFQKDDIVRTPGGHLRIKKEAVKRLWNEGTEQ